MDQFDMTIQQYLSKLEKMKMMILRKYGFTKRQQNLLLQFCSTFEIELTSVRQLLKYSEPLQILKTINIHGWDEKANQSILSYRRQQHEIPNTMVNVFMNKLLYTLPGYQRHPHFVIQNELRELSTGIVRRLRVFERWQRMIFGQCFICSQVRDLGQNMHFQNIRCEFVLCLQCFLINNIRCPNCREVY